MRGSLHTRSGSCLQKQPCTDISQNSWLCYYCILLCAQRWIGSAFSVTKSLGMHTGAGSGNSNTALSWAVKEDNTSCPLWTGLNTEHSNPRLLWKNAACESFNRKDIFVIFIYFSALKRHTIVWVRACLFAWVLRAPVGIRHLSCGTIKSYVISGVT